MKLRLSICSFSTLQCVWAVFRYSTDGEHASSLLPPGGKKTDRHRILLITYTASVCRELRNLPCSRFSLYTSELQRKNPKLLLSVTNTEKYCYKLGGVTKDSCRQPNFTKYTILKLHILKHKLHNINYPSV